MKATSENSASFSSLAEVGAREGVELTKLPFSIRILLESVARAQDGEVVTAEHVRALAHYDPKAPSAIEVPFRPARVLLQDFTGVPAIVDLAAMRSAMARMGGDPARVNPLIPVDLVIDHSVQVDDFGSPRSLSRNESLEFSRNAERYAFLHWGRKAFENLRVVPPGVGICHQVNLEHLATVVQERDGQVFPDSLVGTDSHTPMVGGLGVLGWGVGGIEAEAVMLGQPLQMLAPAVVGVRLLGQLPAGATATDVVLTVTERLRKLGVVGKFVEFYGAGLDQLGVADRATIANMAPEYGATVGFFPVDEQTLVYLRQTGRPGALVSLVERYTKAQGLFRTAETPEPEFEQRVDVDLSEIRARVAGPKRPQDRVDVAAMPMHWREALAAPAGPTGFGLAEEEQERRFVASTPDGEHELGHGAVGIAAITSCTNTSNPSVMMAAGLLAHKAAERGLKSAPWVKTSLAPGSRVVTEYLREAGLLSGLEALGFHVVGYGCTTCIGNSGPLPEPLASLAGEGMVVASVISGNRNFEGRVNPLVKASYLASPPLVVAYALAGRVDIDFETEPIGTDSQGDPVMLADIWPQPTEIAHLLGSARNPGLFRGQYGDVERSSEAWNAITSPEDDLYQWDGASTYIQEPPFFVDMAKQANPIVSVEGARALVVVGDSVTTDHISPAGAIASDSPAGAYLRERGVAVSEFNSYGSRRGNDRVMVRGTFANIRLRNRLAPGTEGGWTTHLPTGEVVSIHEAAQRYADAETPTVVLGGKDYGMGSSRDWAAKGTLLLGVRAVLAESYERIHRSNLVGMGVLPLQYERGQSAATLGLSGREMYDIDLDDALEPGSLVDVIARAEDGYEVRFQALCRLDTPADVATYRHGGVLPLVLRSFLREPRA